MLVDADELERAFAAGKQEGRTETRLDEHDAHLAKINGSIDRFTASVDVLASEIAKFREDARLDRERVKTAAETLAGVTEQNREKLESDRIARADILAASGFKWTKRQVVGTILTSVTIALAGLLAKHYGLI